MVTGDADLLMLDLSSHRDPRACDRSYDVFPASRRHLSVLTAGPARDHGHHRTRRILDARPSTKRRGRGDQPAGDTGEHGITAGAERAGA
jgi:hypothetical protein